MSLQIYNSLTRGKESFEPLVPGRVGMYVCGVTVYDRCHVGHARVMVVFDQIYRWLRQLGYDVDYVRNFTDIDDKIIRRAHEREISCAELTTEMIAAFHEDVRGLNCLLPTHEPRATMHITEMIAMINSLIERGYAYLAGSGDVMYSVRKFGAYGRLSGKNIDDLEAGSRIDVDKSKRDPLDFVLWKRAREGEPSWPSPWGKGRPGWHIECSAMSCAHLGKSFDIHGGGMDLKFPHHENEIAQARAATDGEFARYWLHNGFVNINTEKMSKSLGNFFTIREVAERYPPEVLRMFILGTHYRSPLDFSDEALDTAKSALDRLYETKRRLETLEGCRESPADLIPQVNQFNAAMNDDFNTPEALAALFALSREINRQLDGGKTPGALADAFPRVCDLLGIVQQNADQWFQGDAMDAAQIETLIAERVKARLARDFARADAIRGQLAGMGIMLEDGPNGTTWKQVS